MAAEAGVKLPHYTNTDNPIDFPKRKEIDCPRCGGKWYTDLGEQGLPYTCFHCCNGMSKCFADDGENAT